MWEKVTYYNQQDYRKRMGLPEHSLGLGFLEGEESCYLDYFSDNNNPHLTTEPTKEVGIQEKHASSPGQNSPSQVSPTEEMDDVSTQEEPHPPLATEEFVRQHVSDTLRGIGLDPSTKITDLFPSLQRGRPETPKKSKGIKRSLSTSVERDNRSRRFPPRPVIFPRSGRREHFSVDLTEALMYSFLDFREKFEQ